MTDTPGWAAFTAALDRALAEFVDGERLILSWRLVGEVYVQAAQDESELVIEAVTDRVLPEDRRLGEAGAQRLRAAGWIEPTGERGNWQHFLSWPARTAEYQEAAAMMVSALRDVHGVPDPSLLVYEAWVEQSSGQRDLDLSDLGIAHA